MLSSAKEEAVLKTSEVLLLAFLLTAPFYRALAATQPLFESDEPVALVLNLPLKDLLRRASKKPTVKGVLQYTDADGAKVQVDIEVSTRGKSRLEQCSMPPLSLRLKSSKVDSTLFAGQSRLKLVTQCKKRSLYGRYLRQEYAIYRIYNLLTDYSFRTRLIEVTYRDSDTGRNKVEPAFIIESHKAAAARLGMTTVEAHRVSIRQLDAHQLGILTLFQYMIGNTDWSVRKGPGTDSCCHNGKVGAPPDADEGWAVLPYDFDQSGMINTQYAAPSDLLPIRSVRHRLYRGYCVNNTELDATIALFNDKRAAIEALLAGSPDAHAENKSALKYIRGFYEIINNPKKRQKKILDACVRSGQ